MCRRPRPLLSESPVRRPIPETVQWGCAGQARMGRLRGAFFNRSNPASCGPVQGIPQFSLLRGTEVWIRPREGDRTRGRSQIEGRRGPGGGAERSLRHAPSCLPVASSPGSVVWVFRSARSGPDFHPVRDTTVSLGSPAGPYRLRSGRRGRPGKHSLSEVRVDFLGRRRTPRHASARRAPGTAPKAPPGGGPAPTQESRAGLRREC